jgi:hypothetical protein
MTKIKRGGYIFITWIGDHPPRHVHIYRNGKLVLKFDLERWKIMEGRINGKLFNILTELRQEGLL